MYMNNIPYNSLNKGSREYNIIDTCLGNNYIFMFMLIFLVSYIMFWGVFANMGAERHDKKRQHHINDILFGLIIFGTIFTLGNYKTYIASDYKFLIMGILISLTIWSFISKIEFFRFDLSNMTPGQISAIITLVIAMIIMALPILYFTLKMIQFKDQRHNVLKLLSVFSLLITLMVWTFKSGDIKIHHYQVFGLLALLSNIDIQRGYWKNYSTLLSGLCLGSVSHGLSAYNAIGVATETDDTLIY